MSKLVQCVLRREPLCLKGIVDIHTHMGAWTEYPIPGHDAGAMVRQMDRVGIERMVCAHQSCMTADVAVRQRRSPGRHGPGSRTDSRMGRMLPRQP
ncbi:MAG: hypothetical protein JXR37_14880 [Kiritimatiellae bacterium]|nr:hypothetical protein [Kiritimatiellia bacterium]